MKKKIALGVLLGLAGIAFGIKLWHTHAPSSDSVRHLASGDVVGFEDRENTFAWLGIPFAKPPVGALRWRAPQPVERWSGVREALENGSMCAQVYPFKWPDRLIVLGDEDCLYLDVWAPREAREKPVNSKLPVMVWIHGGANTLGLSGATRSYNLAGKENVIVVSLQYRLGLLGWFSHPALRNTAPEPMDATSNFALLDMVAALQWVRDNIAAFGGDPDNVTIFGQSAGAFDVYALLAAPPARGLFHRAISQSGNIQTLPRPLAENYLDDAEPGLRYSFREFINKLLVADGRAANRDEARSLQQSMADTELADYLRSKPVETLFEAVQRRTGLGYFTPTNIRDGLVLPDKPLLQLFADRTQYNSVPVILGSNRDEYKFFLWGNPALTDKRFGVLPEIRDVDEYNRMTRYFSDQWQVIGVNEPAAVLSKSQPGEVYTYRFDWAGQKPLLGIDMAELIGAGHGLEITFVFGPEAVDTLSLFAQAENTGSREALEAAMMSYWALFARTGEPGNGGNPALPVWEPWREAGAKKMILDRAEAGGVHMSSETLSAAQLKQRLLQDRAVGTTRDRCKLYAQLFYYAMTTDFWSDDEYAAMGCGQYPRAQFEGIL
ncbi:MAG: carboxylesterase family protein [Gammaproteobacteria bacterium]|jgi:para-nitrobenzyl esterase|nr:carboxylesterase family protein [Gammaproteobacteria bacterium]